MSNNIEVRLACNPSELYGVCRLRYEVYVEELKWTSRYADPLTRTISDSFDATGNIFAAFRDDEVLGTLRTHHSGRTGLGSYVDLYRMRKALQKNPHGVCIATMFMVRQFSRGAKIAWELIGAAFEAAKKDGIKQVFIECEPAMINFYRKLGFAVHVPEIVNPEYGPAVCMSTSLEGLATITLAPAAALR